jgi:hypothetical protein
MIGQDSRFASPFFFPLGLLSRCFLFSDDEFRRFFDVCTNLAFALWFDIMACEADIAGE